MKSFLELVEEKNKSSKKVVMSFGRMNPPTSGHMKLIDKVHEIADKNGADHVVIASHSRDAKKNPLSSEQKLKHLKRYSPKTNFAVSSKEMPTYFDHAEKLHKQGYDHLIMVAGSDRVKEYHDNLHKYNGTHPGARFNFKKIEVKSAGHRDPDSEGTEGMSASKMREHAKNNDFSSFREGVPSHVSDTHAKELFKEVRDGMGLHEQYERGVFKAIFITGGPGSGKDLIIREAIAESNAVELNSIQAFDYLADKQRLTEKTTDFRREAIRNRRPLIINGPAEDLERIQYVMEELSELGYSSKMVFVSTTNQESFSRNLTHKRMMVESIRHEKWLKSQVNRNHYENMFQDFMVFENSGSIDSKEQEIHETYCAINEFLSKKINNDIAFSWLEKRGKLNINEKFSKFFRENKYVKNDKRPSWIEEGRKGRTVANSPNRADSPSDSTPDNRAPGGASVGGTGDDINYNSGKKTKTYTFRTYSEARFNETSQPTLQVSPAPKESNFRQDKEKLKKRRYSDSPTQNQRLRNTTGIGPEFDTRQQGTVYPMSGLGDVTYREQKDFKSFRNMFREAIDDPGAVDMGVAGTLSGASNKEPMQTQMDKVNLAGITVKKKKKQEK